jgi:prolyl 4-hydroxylase
MTALKTDTLPAQLTAAGLGPEWQDWIATNLARGCTPESLTDILVEKGYTRDLAVAAVAAMRARGQGLHPAPPAAAPGAYDPEPSRLGQGNPLFLNDRMVHVAARLERPELAVLAGLLSDAECEGLIECSKHKLKRSTVVNPATGRSDNHADRISEGTSFSLGENELVARLDRRLAELTGWPVENGEGLQILHYSSGGQYKPHFDYFPPGDPGSAVHLARGGQRVATVVMYLNDVQAGGETHFPDAGGLRVLPRRGWAVYFAYCDGAGRVDPLTLHAGAPVRAGEKWIATKWIRQGPYR